MYKAHRRTRIGNVSILKRMRVSILNTTNIWQIARLAPRYESVTSTAEPYANVHEAVLIAISSVWFNCTQRSVLSGSIHPAKSLRLGNTVHEAQHCGEAPGKPDDPIFSRPKICDEVPARRLKVVVTGSFGAMAGLTSGSVRFKLT